LSTAINSARLLRHILAKRFATIFFTCQFGDIRNKAVSHFKRKYELLYGCGTCYTAVLQAERPSYKLQSPAMPPCLQKCLSENIPCLVQFSAAAMSAKILYQKYASSRLGSLYATKMGHASTATQPESFPKLVNSTRSTDHSAKALISADAKAGFGKELGYRQQAERSHDLGCESISQPVVSAISLIGNCLRSFLESLDSRQCRL
jgi:hypothetical protein